MTREVAGYRVHMVQVPDDPAAPRVLYLVPVDARERKAGQMIVGTLSRTRADKIALGDVLPAVPALGVYTPPAREPSE